MVLLTAVLVILALIVGAAIIASTSANADEKPRVDFVVDATTAEVTLTHNGGDTVDRQKMVVTLSQGNVEDRFDVSASMLSGTDDQVDPADEITITLPAGYTSGDLRVRVYHEPSNTLLTSDRVTVPS